MEPARIVIPFSLRKLEHRIDVKLTAKSSSGRDQRRSRSRWAAVIANLILLLLSFYCAGLPALAQTGTAAGAIQQPELKIGDGVLSASQPRRSPRTRAVWLQPCANFTNGDCEASDRKPKYDHR